MYLLELPRTLTLSLQSLCQIQLTLIMAKGGLNCKERKFVVKWYMYQRNDRTERQVRELFQGDLLMRCTIGSIRDRFEARGTVHDVHKQCAESSQLSTCPAKEEKVLKTLL